MRNSTIIFVIALFLFVGICPMTAQVFGEEKGETEAYTYDPTGKPDPFMPFIKTTLKKSVVKKVLEKGENGEVVEKSVFLPPLQRVDIELFNLVGIGERGGKRIAMVEGSDGKSYVLQRGSHIGLNEGKVTQVLPDQVVIVEKIKDAFGKSISNRVILRLQRGEDEGEL
ncbi:MAG: pilus assembly protein PilP [Deltaproteobacteria bacterium]|nr:pilus assembly protein PilP [Deltaproteobacteria bacterium]